MRSIYKAIIDHHFQIVCSDERLDISSSLALNTFFLAFSLLVIDRLHRTPMRASKISEYIETIKIIAR